MSIRAAGFKSTSRCHRATCGGRSRPSSGGNGLRQHVWDLGARPAIPPQVNEAHIACPAPICNNRNRAERLWARLKEWRAVDTQNEKTAASFLGVLRLAATADWLRRQRTLRVRSRGMQLLRILARNLQRSRRAYGLPQEELAALARLNRNSIGMLGREENAATVDVIERPVAVPAADVLGCDSP
ncbi:transposase [Belnapia sp. T6]|uniref:Transposase n=2 Tax=Belnapia mucosa TaxID=2804532 RepID=A0ABS1V523_9PROT|nr:transposase [Belnapia mucosa]